MDWDASTYSGTFGDGWTDSVGGVFAQQGGGDGPVKSVATIAGASVDVIEFSADSFDVFWTTAENPGAPPFEGLSEYSISIVFSTTSAGAGSEDNWYQWNGLVGVENPGPGVGDWTLGLSENGFAGGGGSLGGGDVGTLTTAPLAAGYHTMTFVLEDNGDATHSQYLYLDGVLQTSDLNIAYGGATVIDSQGRFAIGARFAGDNGFIDANIARIQFDDTALSQGEIDLLHADYLGEVPEPGAAACLALSGLALLARRRRG